MQKFHNVLELSPFFWNDIILLNIIRHFPTSSWVFWLFHLKVYFKHHRYSLLILKIWWNNFAFLQNLFRFSTKSTKFWCIDVIFGRYVTHDVIPSTFFASQHSHMTMMMMMYLYNRISRNVIHLWRHRLRHPLSRLSRFVRLNFGDFLAFDSLYIVAVK